MLNQKKITKLTVFVVTVEPNTSCMKAEDPMAPRYSLAVWANNSSLWQ